MKYVHVYALFLKPAATQIMLGEQIRWVFANTGILEADGGSVWFVGVGATGKLYRYDARLNDEVGQGPSRSFKSKEGQK